MNSEQRQQIRLLVKKYSDSGTESLIAFVAGTNGMLAACQALLCSVDAVGSTSAEWLEWECTEGKVAVQSFLSEVSKIVALFHPSNDTADHHATLGVSADANLDEIKQAYRALSLRYHPDTASPQYHNNPEKFITITKAYHALMNRDTNGENDVYLQPENQWRRKQERRVTPEQRKKAIKWTLVVLFALAVVSTIAAMNYKKRAMLAGLQESRGAFIPPSRKVFDVSTEEVKVEFQQPERLPEIVVPASIPGMDIVPKVESVREVEAGQEIDAFGLRMKDLPQQDSENVIAASAGSENEKRKIEHPDTIRPIRVKERTALAALSSTPESTAVKASAEVIGNQTAGHQADVKGKVERLGDKSIAVKTGSRNSSNTAFIETEKSDQPAPGSKHQPAGKTHTESRDPDLVFTTPTQASAVKITGVKTEKEVPLSAATVTEVAPLSVDPFRADKRKLQKSDMQMRVDRFFADYTKAYEQRNLIIFARFFEADAEENGKPFTANLPTYLDLFASTRHISLQVGERSWHLVDGKVAVDGRFKIYLEYADGRIINGSGPIGFVLEDNGGELLVNKMEYDFHTD